MWFVRPTGTSSSRSRGTWRGTCDVTREAAFVDPVQPVGSNPCRGHVQFAVHPLEGCRDCLSFFAAGRMEPVVRIGGEMGEDGTRRPCRSRGSALPQDPLIAKRDCDASLLRMEASLRTAGALDDGLPGPPRLCLPSLPVGNPAVFLSRSHERRHFSQWRRSARGADWPR